MYIVVQRSYQEKHVYDYIHQTPHESSIKAYKESNTPPPPLLRSNNLRADYQVPPPPRPIEQFETHAATTQKYVKMIPESQNQTVVNDSSKSKRSTTPVRQIRLPSLSVITSTLRLRSKERGDSVISSGNAPVSSPSRAAFSVIAVSETVSSESAPGTHE